MRRCRTVRIIHQVCMYYVCGTHNSEAKRWHRLGVLQHIISTLEPIYRLSRTWP